MLNKKYKNKKPKLDLTLSELIDKYSEKGHYIHVNYMEKGNVEVWIAPKDKREDG